MSRSRDRPAATRLLKNVGHLIATCRCRIGDRHRQLFSRCRPYHPGRDRATPTTPFEIDGVTQVWRSSARYAQFRAQAFPSSLPSRSRCRALAGLVRAQTSNDIRPRALCTPPPKSFAHSPGPLPPANAATGSRCDQHLSRPEYTSRPIVTFAPQHLLRCGVAEPCASHAIREQDAFCSVGEVPADSEAVMSSSNSDHARAKRAVQETARALDSVSQRLDVFRAELEKQCQPATNDSNPK